MNFIGAVRYLSSNGYKIKPSSTFRKGERMYQVSGDDLEVPVLMSTKAVTSSATVFKYGLTSETAPFTIRVD